MRFGPLTLFQRTSSDKTINLASWHSPHSLTWRWIMSLRRHQLMWPKPFARRDSVGFGAGIGTLLSFWAYKDNSGWQWGLCALWHGLHFGQQRPMWFKDMCRRSWDECEELKRENRKLRRDIDLVQHNAVRLEGPPVGIHLN